MTSISEIFQTFGPKYLERFADTMPQDHRKTIDAIMECRTHGAGITYYECIECGHSHLAYRSCGNRHCPACQHHKSRQWLEAQMNRQLPGHHFMITFTVPAPVRRFIRSHQKIAYAALFEASSQAIKKLVPDNRYIGEISPAFMAFSALGAALWSIIPTFTT